jgi:PAS domain-containing protein
MSPLETILHECGSAAGIGFWRFDAERGLLHWPRGFGPERDASYGSWWRLGDFGQFCDAADRARLFDYFENLFAPETPPFTLEIPIAGPGKRLQLRIEGKQLPISDHLLAGGLVRDISRRAEAEERARSLSQILEALIGSVQSGVIVLDSHGHIRKANQKAFDLFGASAAGSIDAAAMAELTSHLPPSLLDTIRRCRQARSRADGASAGVEGLTEPMTWEANPWGRDGVVIVIRPEGLFRPSPPLPLAGVSPDPPSVSIRAPDPAAATALARDRALLDYVRHPCLIIQSRDASIDFANRIACDKFGIKPGIASHINNLFEITGRQAPRNTYVTAGGVNAVVTLPMGARVARMTDIDPDLYFVEYL